jgi:hypothetical protein
MCDGSIGANDGSIRFIASGGIRFGNTFKTLVSNSQVYITAQNTTSNEYKFCLFSFVSGKSYNIKLYFQLEKGSKANTYTPYGTTPIELCKIGNYQDYFYKDSDKWYLHKEIGKVDLNGSENIWVITGNNVYATNENFINISTKNNARLSFSNYYIFNPVINNVTSTIANGEYALQHGVTATGRIFLKNTNISSVASFKTWLSTHNVSVYYIEATPTNTEITDTTLINQLEEFYQAQSKNNQTNISQINNDLPFIVSASALKKDDATPNNNVSLLTSVEESPNTNVEEEIDEEPMEEIDEEPVEEETEIEEEGE